MNNKLLAHISSSKVIKVTGISVVAALGLYTKGAIDTIIADQQAYKVIPSWISINYQDSDNLVHVENDRAIVDIVKRTVQFSPDLFSENLLSDKETNQFLLDVQQAINTLNSDGKVKNGKMHASLWLDTVLPLYTVIAKKYNLPLVDKNIFLELLDKKAVSMNTVELATYHSSFLVKTIQYYLETQGFKARFGTICTGTNCTIDNAYFIRYRTKTPSRLPHGIFTIAEKTLHNFPSLSLGNINPDKEMGVIFVDTYAGLEDKPIQVLDGRVPTVLISCTYEHAQSALVFKTLAGRIYRNFLKDVHEYTPDYVDSALSWEEDFSDLFTVKALLNAPYDDLKRGTLSQFAIFAQQQRLSIYEEVFIPIQKMRTLSRSTKQWTLQDWKNALNKEALLEMDTIITPKLTSLDTTIATFQAHIIDAMRESSSLKDSLDEV